MDPLEVAETPGSGTDPQEMSDPDLKLVWKIVSKNGPTFENPTKEDVVLP